MTHSFGEEKKEGASLGPIRLKKTRNKRVSTHYMLADDDIILAVNGTPWIRIESLTATIGRLLGRRKRPVLLTVYRDQQLFNVFVDSPIDCEAKVVSPQEAQDVQNDELERPIWEIRRMSNFVVFSDTCDNADILEERMSLMAMICPPLWLLTRRLWTALVSVACALLTAFVLNTVLGILVYLFLCVYISSRQLQLFEVAMQSEGKKKHMVLAALNEKQAQKIAIAFYSELKFKFPLQETVQSDRDEISAA